MGFSSKTWGQRWAEDGTYADMLEIFVGSYRKLMVLVQTVQLQNSIHSQSFIPSYSPRKNRDRK